MKTLLPDSFNGISLKYDTPDGPAYIHIVEESPGKIKQIFFTVGKAGTSVNAWAFALAEMTTYALEHGASLHEIINKLSNITSERLVRSAGMNLHSGPDALFLSLLKYRQSLAPKLHKLRPARSNRRFRAV